MSHSQTIRPYTDIKNLFELQVPSDWLADTSGQMGTRVAFLSPDVEAGFQANVNVVVSHLSPLTREEFLAFSRLQLKQLSGEAKLPVDESCDDQLGTNSHVAP